MNILIWMPIALLLAACGTTFEGERLSQTAGLTDMEFSACMPVEGAECIPVTFRWTDGKSKASITAKAYNIVTGDLVFEYTATEVTQPETVMQTIALVKGEIAKAQLALGGKAVDALANGIVGALLGGGGILPGGGVAVPTPSE